MSREILFRAWHKKRKKYYEVLHLHINELEGNWATCKGYNIIEQKDIHIQVQPEECIIEQYTGLKDKNGNNIFEGDKLSLDGDCVGHIIYDDGCFHLLVEGNQQGRSPILQERTKRFKITGNIHQ